MTLALQTPVEKKSITGDVSNNSEANGGQRCGDFPVFQKNKAVLCIFWSKFLLRNVFLNDCKVCC